MKVVNLSKSLLAMAVMSTVEPGIVYAESEQRIQGLEELVVTARRRVETSQSVPISLGALDEDQLVEKGVTDLKDLTSLSPGLRVVTTGGGTNADISMRGLKRVPIGDGASAVVVYFADVALPYNASIVPTFDLQNVQVFKGPQGTLFGRNTLGGAVSLTPVEPHGNGVEGYAKASVGNFNSHLVEGAVNLPVSDDVSVRLAYQQQKADGYVENIGVGNDLNDINNESLRASLLWTPADNIMNLTVVDYMEADEAGTASVIVENARNPFGLVNTLFAFSPEELDAVIANQEALGPYKSDYSDAPVTTRKFWGVSNKTEWDTDTFTVRNIIGYREARSFVTQDTDGGNWAADGGGVIPGTGGIPIQPGMTVFNANSADESSQLTNELQVFGSALDENLDWIVGAFYLTTEAEGPSGTQFPVLVPRPWNVAFNSRDNIAIFAQGGYAVESIEGLSINAGYRYTWDESESCGFTEALPAYKPTTNPSDCPSSAAVKRDGEEGTWTFGLDYQFSEDIFVYGVTRRGFREGGLNTPVLDNTAFAPYQSYEPEFITDVEIGIKTDWTIANIPVRYNLTVFQTDYEDIQALVNVTNYSAVVNGDADPNNDVPAVGYSSLNINGGEATITGAESDLTVMLTDELTINLMVNYLHQSVDEHAPAPLPFTSPPEITSPTPQWSSTASIRYGVPIESLNTDLVINADVYWSDDFTVGVWEGESYSVANLRIQLDGINGGGFGVSLWAKNILDEEYWSAGGATTPSLGFYTAQVGAPRTYGMELSYKFGH